MIRIVGGSVVVLAFVASGCPASVNGEIDGKAVDALYSAFFTQTETKDPDSFSVGGAGVSLLDGCNGAARRQENTNELQKDLNDAVDGETDPEKLSAASEDFANGLVDYDTKNVPTDYWFVSVGVGAESAGDIDDFDIDLEDPPEQDANGSVSICRVNDHPEVDSDEIAPDLEVFTAKTDQDCFVAKKGEVKIEAFEEEEVFTIVADVEVLPVDDDGSIDIEDDGDSVIINLSGGFCKPLQDALDEAQDIAEDAAG